ncbi:MAG: ATP-binding protein [Phenylobacterium sp.]|uniref:ATP-binding protein n=1 Tax=Phenylobacterium sp. TaxID=1871053 RepID=UPI0030159AE7
MTPPEYRQKALSTSGFHARISAAAVVTALSVLVLACLAFMGQQWVQVQAQNRALQSTLAAVSAVTLSDAVSSGDAAAVDSSVRALGLSHLLVSAEFFDASGQRVSGFGQAGQLASPSSPGGSQVVIRTPVEGKGVHLGELVTVGKRLGLAEVAPQLLALAGALLFSCIGVAIVISRRLADQVIVPVVELSTAMQMVSDTDSYEPIHLASRDGLFRGLSSAFNQLLHRLSVREVQQQSMVAELQDARDRADDANLMKSQFLANMSHEIRTPLNGVLTMAEIMAMGDLPGEQRKRLDVVRQSGDLLLKILNDVLDLSKIEAGRMTLSEEDFDLEAALSPVRDLFAPSATEKGLEFVMRTMPGAKGGWRGDPGRLRQILGNLVSNAVKFTHSGSITVLLDEVADQLVITVRDTGVGIPTEKHAMLFEKFVQVDNSATRRFGGTGLGLAISAELAQMMGGRIAFESTEGLGTTFRFSAPLMRATGVDAVEFDDGLFEDEEEAAPLRVLAAEDNATNQQVLTAVMASLGCALEIVPDGAAAVAAWKTGRFDIILMDIHMPVMGGVEAATAIRALERNRGLPRTPIIALTADAMTHQVAEYLAAGMDAHLAKPIEIKRLIDTLHRVSQASEMNAAPASARGAL